VFKEKIGQKKLQDDSETCNYLHANTKDCPKCHKPIEKDGGCNLVTCPCGAHMCWLCGAPTGSAHDWEKIEGHSCGKWKDDSTEKDEEFARNSLKRFMHYYDRFKANDDTKKLHPKMIEDVLNKMLIVQNRFAFDADWLRRGLSQLFECRRILSYSYVFAFFMFDDQNKAVQKKNQRGSQKYI